MSSKKQGILQCILVALIIFASVTISKMLGTKRQVLESSYGEKLVINVNTVEVSPGPYQIAFETTGVVEARSEVSIVPQVSGRVDWIDSRFFEGGNFVKGETLFTIEDQDFKLDVNRLEAEVARAETNLLLEKAEASAALAEWQQVHGEKEAPDLVARKPQVAEAHANLKAARAQLEDARLDVRRTRFSLPFNGKVLNSNLAVGQYVAAGQNYGSVFDSETLEVRASLDDSQLNWLFSAETPEIIITAKFLGKIKRYPGFVQRGIASFNSQTRFARISFSFKEADDSIVPGQFVNISIEGSRLEDIIRLPAESLQKDGLIWLVDSNATLSSLNPDIVYADNKHIAARWKNQPLKVVTSRLSGAIEGMSVQVQNVSRKLDHAEERLSKKKNDNGQKS